jgi:hypothetical protein
MSRNVLRAPGAAAVLAFAGGLYMMLDGAGEDRRPGSAEIGGDDLLLSRREDSF